MEYVYMLNGNEYKEEERDQLAYDFTNAEDRKNPYDEIMEYYIRERRFDAWEIADLFSDFLFDFDYKGEERFIKDTLIDMKEYMTRKGWESIGSDDFGIKVVDEE